MVINTISNILIEWGTTNAAVGDNAVTLPHAFSGVAIGVVSRATMNLSSAMTNAMLAFPDQNLTWIQLNSGSNTTEILHWVVVGF